MERVTPVVLAIGTTHPLNIAGVGLVARAADRLGIRLVTIVAGVSAQNARGVLARQAIDPELIAQQFVALADAPIDAIHIGALVNAASVRAVAAGLAAFARVPVVCDPVIAATGGDRLADDATVVALRDALFAHVTLVTPNLAEASSFLDRPVMDIRTMERAGDALRAYGAQAVLVKGGHLADAPIDVLVTPDGVRHFAGERLGETLRGTGDLLAGAIAARLGWGDDLATAIMSARRFVRASIAGGVAFAGARTLA